MNLVRAELILTLASTESIFNAMSLTELKDQARNLPPNERRELIAYLVALQTAGDEDFKRKLSAKIDDKDPAHWVELNEAQKRYGQ
jgi:hypothetical protein